MQSKYAVDARIRQGVGKGRRPRWLPKPLRLKELRARLGEMTPNFCDMNADVRSVCGI